MMTKPQVGRRDGSRNKDQELPRDLNQRKAIYRNLIPLKYSLFVRPKSQYVVQIGPLLPHFASPDRRAEFHELEFGPRPPETTHRIITTLAAHNLRLAEVAEQVRLLRDDLLVAALPVEDLEWWEADALVAAEVREKHGHSAPNHGNDYVNPQGFSDYEFEFHERLEVAWEAVREKLSQAAKRIERLAEIVVRLDRTISPDAVAERLIVDRMAREASLDGVVFTDFKNDDDLIYLHHLRRVGGEWVSAPDIQRMHGHSDFRDDRCRSRFEKTCPTLLACIDVGHRGSRIVLPMPKLDRDTASR